MKFLFFKSTGWKMFIARSVLTCFSWIIGSAVWLPYYWKAKLRKSEKRYPVVIFSHGLAGNRFLYSTICGELASHGYVVFAVEHADGTASAAHLAGRRGWLLYAGLGLEPVWRQRTALRARELMTAHSVLRGLSEGVASKALRLDGLSEPELEFKDALDFTRVAAVGHSYGGATAALTASQHPQFQACVCLDPWWPALPPQSAALTGWATRAPVLVIGSHDWNIPDAVTGEMKCGAAQQRRLLEAARIRDSGGGGALLVVPKGSDHHSFNDPPVLLQRVIERGLWLLRKVAPRVADNDLIVPRSSILPSRAHYLVTHSIRYFLNQRQPLMASGPVVAAPQTQELNANWTGTTNARSKGQQFISEEDAKILRELYGSDAVILEKYQ